MKRIEVKLEAEPRKLTLVLVFAVWRQNTLLIGI